MELNFNKFTAMSDALEGLKDQKLPFKLSLIIAKNLGLIRKETEFYIEQEREFAQKYLQTDEDGKFVQEGENIFKIKPGLEEECSEARRALNNFTTEVELRPIPANLLDTIEFTPDQLLALEDLIVEEE